MDASDDEGEEAVIIMGVGGLGFGPGLGLWMIGLARTLATCARGKGEAGANCSKGEAGADCP